MKHLSEFPHNWEISIGRKVHRLRPSTGVAILSIIASVSFAAGFLVQKAYQGDSNKARPGMMAPRTISVHPDNQIIEKMIVRPKNHNLLYRIEKEEKSDAGVEL